MADRDIRIVYTTIGSEADAAEIARAIVGERLAACANIIPRIRSVFRWQGKVEDEPESVVLFKCAADRVDALIARIDDLHPYDVPDIVAIPVDRGHVSYLDWVVTNSSQE